MIDFEINDKGTLVWNDGSSRPATHQEQELTYEIAYRDDQIKALQAEVERLRRVLNEEADYCQSFADQFSHQDRERAARHQARADRLRNSAKEQAND